MKTDQLSTTALQLMAGNKGLLAMDESTHSIDSRFEKAGIPQTVEYRRAWRELIVTTPGIGECLNGAILYDETVYQKTKDGVPFVGLLEKAGVIPGIKVDEGTVPLAGFPGEKIALGLDTLRQRLEKYRVLGMRFAKWRVVFSISDEMPTEGCIHANTHALARYAGLCQEAGIVPIVEPEVLMEGTHDMLTTYTVTRRVLRALFEQLADQRVDLPGMLLKPNMIIPGLQAEKQESVEEVAKATVHCLVESVPAMLQGVAFLSGGQTPKLASAHLNAIHGLQRELIPWPLTFSYSRAIQQPALEYWKGRDENIRVAQRLLYGRMKLNVLARAGMYLPEMEKEYS
jgi:fructose-bisphosphate aldolase class I